ncbi:hypothetical protein AABM34_18130 [Lysinibacillus fusiformis]
MRFLKIENYLIELKNEIIAFKEKMNNTEWNSNFSEKKSDLISNMKNAESKKKKAMSDEKLIEFIQEIIDKAGLSAYFRGEINSLKGNLGAYTNTEISDFDFALNSILTKIDLLFYVESLTKTNQEKYNYIYAVKLPKYEYFDDVADFTKQLNFIFSTVMQNNRKVKLVGFDKGSEWYQIALDSLSDFKLMALFIGAVTKYVKIKLEDKQRENEIELDDATKMLILDNMETNQRAIKEYTVKSILSENGNIDDHEQYERHQRAFENMAELMIKGTRVDVDKQITTNDSEQNEPPLKLPNLESVQELLEMHRDYLIEHSESDE